MAINDSNYTPIDRTFTGGNNLTYTPKYWEENELIERAEMNNIEQGIQIALAQTDEIQETADQAVAQVNDILTQFRDDYNYLTNKLPANISSDVQSTLSANNTNIITSFQNLLGSQYVNGATTLPLTLPNGLDTVDDRITQLYTAIFGTGSNNNITILQTNLADLDTYVRGASNTNSLTAQITTLQNELGGSGSGTSFRAKVEAAIGRPLEPTAQQINANGNLGENLLTLIENLQRILGVNSSSSGEKSLIEKIEENIGRTLDASYIGVDENEKPYNNSLIAMITQIQNILGLNGEVAQDEGSSLINLVNDLANIIYGNDRETALISSLRNFEDDFYNIPITQKDKDTGVETTITQSAKELLTSFYSTIADVNQKNDELSKQLSQKLTTITRSENAYIAAKPLTLGDNEYLVLQRDTASADATSENDVAEGDYNNNTYIRLPKGGGGGGAETTYPFEASIINVQKDPTTIKVGDTHFINFTWEVITRGALVTDESSRQTVTGNLNIRMNNTLVHTQTVTSNTNIRLDLGQFMTAAGSNVLFRITITNEMTNPASVYDTITAYNAIISSTFDPNIIQTGNYINFPYSITVGSATISKTLHIEIDGRELNLTGNTFSREGTGMFTFATPENGSHLLRIWFVFTVDSITISSNILTYGILCGTSTQTRIATNFASWDEETQKGTIIERYDTLIIPYLVVTPNQSTTYVEFYLDNDTTPIQTANVGPVYNNFSYPVTSGRDILKITIKANGAEKILFVKINDEGTYDFSMVVDNLQLYLNGVQRSNTEQNPAKWNNSAQQSIQEIYLDEIEEINNSDDEDKETKIAATRNKMNAALANLPSFDTDNPILMENFLFYKDVDGWQSDANGQGFLRLRNRNKVTIPFSVFPATSSNNMTFEVDFRTSNVANYNAEIIACYQEDEFGERSNSKTIIFTAQDAKINNTTTLDTKYKEDERLTVTFVIENGNYTVGETIKNSPVYKLFKIYVNGIMSGAIQYSSDDLSFTNNGKIVLGSEDCTLDIYSIKYYNTALTFPQVIQNYIANSGSFSEKISIFNRNNYRNTGGYIDFDAFTKASPTTPYMVITGEGYWKDSTVLPQAKSDGTYSTSVTDPKKSTIAKGIKVRYVDPVNEQNNFDTEYDGGEVGVAVQGTSSQEYMVKNYKIKLTQFRQNKIIHKKKVKDSDYDIVYETIHDEETGTDKQVEVSRTLKTGISKEGYKLSPTSIPTFTFCVKADVASSESLNNTKLVEWYDRIVRNIVLTPPQGDDARIRQGVEGYPMVIWYYDNLNKKYYFLGKFNFNNDKGTEEVFGFEGADENWEIGNNEQPLCFFQESSNPEADWTGVEGDGKYPYAWRSAFEPLFPDDDDPMTGVSTDDKPAYTLDKVKDRLAGLRQVVHWVSSTVQWDDPIKQESVHFNIQPIAEDYVANSTDTEEVREEKAKINAFKREFKTYFNLPLMTFFFVFTEFFLMIDNRAKNMRMTRYQVTPTRPQNSDWHNDYDSLVNTLDSSASVPPEQKEYLGWFSLPYDMDTAMGIDNKGAFAFDYHYETGDYQPDGKVVFNGQRSKLWSAFTQVFQNEIKDTYMNFQRNFTYDILETDFERHQSVWSETAVNEDMINKYIEWITNTDSNGIPTKRDDRALPMLLGTKREQRRWWLSNRYIYMNSKYGIIENDDLISLGLSVGNFNLPVSVSGDCYVMFKVGASDPYPIIERASNTQAINLIRVESSGMAVADRVESSLSPASRIRSVENLSVLKLKNADFSKAINLQSLRIGSPINEEKNDSFKELTLSSNPVLRLLDIRNCTNYVNDLTVNGCLNLEKIYLAKTRISNVNLPEGGVLKTIQYPSTIKTIKIINQPYLENLIIGSSLPENEFIEKDRTANIEIFDPIENDYSDIEALYLDNVGLITNRQNIIDSAKIIKQMPSTGYVYLDNISWEMTVEEFKEIFDKITDMNGFEDGVRSTTVKAVLGGTLYLHGSFPQGFSLADIGARFGNKLKVVYVDEQGNEHPYYTVAFYGLNNELLETQYVPKGEEASPPNISQYFTITYINNYNILKDSTWQDGNSIRWNFSNWDKSFANITQRTEVYAESAIQYRMNYVLQNAKGEDEIIYDYFFEGAEITDKEIPSFEKDYYNYSKKDWTLDGNRPADCVQNGDDREEISLEDLNKNNNATGIQTWYAIYTRGPQTYYVKIYNTDINGNKTLLKDPTTNEDVIFPRAVIESTNGYPTVIKASDLRKYIPNNTNKIAMIGAPEGEEDLPDEERQYRFLNWKPYVSSRAGENLQVTGNMDICLTYYNINDYFNNYFLNKLEDCQLGITVQQLPDGAFFHNSNLKKLRTSARQIGNYAFANFATTLGNPTESDPKWRIFIFDAGNIEFGSYCFYNLRKAIIVFTGTGTITVNNYSFNGMQNCHILIPNSENPVIVASNADQNAVFSGFTTNNNNKIYVKNQNVYPQSTSSTFSQRIPYSLVRDTNIISEINSNNTDYIKLAEEAGIL